MLSVKNTSPAASLHLLLRRARPLDAVGSVASQAPTAPLSSRANSDAGGWSLTTPRELAARQNRHLASA